MYAEAKKYGLHYQVPVVDEGHHHKHSLTYSGPLLTDFTFFQVSIQLYTAREKQQLTDLVDTMISYNLTYQQERGADGQYTYVLDP